MDGSSHQRVAPELLSRGQAAVRWAKQQGYIDVNPIADMEQPKAGKRETVLSQAEFDRLVKMVLSRESETCLR